VRTVSRTSRWAERLAWVGGLALLSWWTIFTATGATGAHRALRQFATMRSEWQAARDAGAVRIPSTGAIGASLVTPLPDQRLWSEKRVRAWRDTLYRPGSPPLAVLRIPRIGIEVAVLEGTDDWTLNRAVGHIEETAKPGAAGNIGIAGHRDGFFRPLQDVRIGDRLEVQTLDGMHVYRIARTWIVEPDDVSVLDPTSTPSVTLVTCYPFYFVGPAPRRFIVRAERVGSS
jgi:sortase A